MKKVGYLFVFVGLCLLVFPFLLKLLGNPSNKKFKKFDNVLLTSVTLKHGNINHPTIETFTFPEELSCDYTNDYSFTCDNYYDNAFGKEKGITIKGYVSDHVDMSKIIKGFNDSHNNPNTNKVDVENCPQNMKCFRYDELVYDESGNLDYYNSDVDIIIDNQDYYYTFIILKLSIDSDNYDKDIPIINNFISSIKIEDYKEKERTYKDDKLEYSLTVPKYNESSELKLYLDKERYSYPNSAYLDTNNKISIKTINREVDFDIYIKYYYEPRGVDNEYLRMFFPNEVAVDDESVEKIMVGDKEVYKPKNERKYFLHYINKYYYYFVSSSSDLSDEDLLELFDFKYE